MVASVHPDHRSARVGAGTDLSRSSSADHQSKAGGCRWDRKVYRFAIGRVIPQTAGDSLLLLWSTVYCVKKMLKHGGNFDMSISFQG